MKKIYYLAIDIGASSGRHILGCVKDGKISLEECNARRFKLTKKYLPEECPEDWVKSIP